MWGSDWELCARADPPTIFNFYWVKRSKLPARAWVYRVIPGSLPIYFADVAITPEAPHFPWGNPVDPD
jgi:hypothetical protein